MNRPTTYPDHSLDDAGNFSEPTSDIKANGFADGAIPPAKHFNWAPHWISKWIRYLDEQMQLYLGYSINSRLIIAESDIDNLEYAVAGIVTTSTNLSMELYSDDPAMTPIAFTAIAYKYLNMVTLRWPDAAITLAGGSWYLRARMVSGSIPSWVLPAGGAISGNIVVVKNGTKPGRIYLSDPIEFSFLKVASDNLTLVGTEWYGYSGIKAGCMTYRSSV